MSNEWYAVSVMVQTMCRAKATRNEMYRETLGRCKRLFKLKCELEKRLKGAEKAFGGQA